MTKKEKAKKRDQRLYLDRETLFNGITFILNCFEGSGFEFKKTFSANTRYLHSFNEYVGESYATYKIVRGEETILKDMREAYQMEDGKVYVGDKKMNLDFTQVVDLLEPLYTSYPYLKGIIDKMRIAILLDGSIDEMDILNLARDYVLEGLGLNDVTEFATAMRSHNSLDILSTLDRRIELKQKKGGKESC